MQQREDRHSGQLPGLVDGLLRLSWKTLQRIPHLASRHKLLLFRIKSNSISGWNRDAQRRGCPHCIDAGTAGGSISHIFWQCPSAQHLWQAQFALWGQCGLKMDDFAEPTLLRSVFSLQLPRMPSRLWQLKATRHQLDPNHVISVHGAVREAWRQHCVATLAAIWRWRCGPLDQDTRWTRHQAVAYAGATCRTSWALLADSLIYHNSPSSASDVVAELRDTSATTVAEDVDNPPPATISPVSTTSAGQAHRILFFDGGSRGNPGPGGAGSVLVESDATGAATRILWCAAFSYPDPTTTNNYAEYQGVVEGLAEAQRRGYRGIHVVGDSNLILTQLRNYHPPKHRRLRPLYARARRLADELGITRWSHHLRGYNKMADAAANLAMDHGPCCEHSHPTPSSAFLALLSSLHSDVAKWSEEWLRATHL